MPSAAAVLGSGILEAMRLAAVVLELLAALLLFGAVVAGVRSGRQSRRRRSVGSASSDVVNALLVLSILGLSGVWILAPLWRPATRRPPAPAFFVREDAAAIVQRQGCFMSWVDGRGIVHADEGRLWWDEDRERWRCSPIDRGARSRE